MLKRKKYEKSKCLKYFILSSLFIISFFVFPYQIVSAHDIEWARQFGDQFHDNSSDISVDSSGVYVVGSVAGSLSSNINLGGSDVFIKKYDYSGNEIWTRQFGTTANDGATGIFNHSTGIYIIGRTCGALPGQIKFSNCDAFIRKYDVNGNEIWTRQFGITASRDTSPTDISVDSSGVYIVGEVRIGIAFLRKYDFDGNELWTRSFGGTISCGYLTFNGVVANGVTADLSGVFVVGETDCALPGQSCLGSGYVAPTDAFLRKYDLNGNELWTKQFGTSVSDSAKDIIIDSSYIYLIGNTEGAFPNQTNFGSYDVFVQKYDLNGNMIWTNQFGSAEFDYNIGISIDATGIYASGDTKGALLGQSNLGGKDFFVKKYDYSGNEIWTRQFGTATDDNIGGIFAHSTGIYAVGNTYGAFSGQTNVGYADAFVIKLFSELRQFKSDGQTIISEGDTTTESTAVFEAIVSDPNTDSVKLQVELKEFNKAFDGQDLLESDFVASGSEAVITRYGLINGQYHWRARVVDIYGNASDWKEFGEAGNVDFVVKLVPLYTQVESQFPSRLPEDEWASEDYASGGIGTYSCAKYDRATIARCGCAITSSVMILRYYDIATAIDGQDANPKNINDWLNTNGGYTSGGNLKWGKVSEYSKSSSISLARLQFDGIIDSKDTGMLNAYTQSLRPVILQHKTLGHFFVADGKLSDTYTIKDPAWYNTKNLNDTRIGSYIRNYDNHFDGLRLFSAFPASLNNIYLNLASPAEFLIIDPSGRKLGKDPISGIAYNEIPGGIYFQEGISDGTLETPPLPHESKNIWIPEPIEGQYAVNVIGTDAGSYTFESLAYDAQSQAHFQTISSNTQTALVSEYNLNFTPSQPENINIQLVAESIDECPTLNGNNIGCPAKIDFLSEEKISNSAELPELIGPQGETRYTAPVVEGQRGTIEVKAKLYNETSLLNLSGNPRSIPLDQLCAIFDDASKDGALVSHLVKTTDSDGKFSFGVPSLSATHTLIESVREIIAGQPKRVCILETISPRDFDSSGIAFKEVNQISLTVRKTHTGEILVKKTAGHNSQTINE